MDFNTLKNQNGAAMLIAIIILILITIIGLAAISFSTFNLEIAGYKLKDTENFYSGESVAVQAANIIDTSDISEIDQADLSWLYKKQDLADWISILESGLDVSVAEKNRIISSLKKFTQEPKLVDDDDIRVLFSQEGLTFKEDFTSSSDQTVSSKVIAIYNGVANQGSQDIGKGDSLREYIIIAQFEKIQNGKKTGEKFFEIGVRRSF